MLKTRKRSISLIVTLAFLLTFIIPVGSAFAATKNTTVGAVPNIAETGNYNAASLRIDEDVLGNFAIGDVITLTLTDAKFNGVPVVTPSGDAAAGWGGTLTTTVTPVTDKVVNIKIGGAVDAAPTIMTITMPINVSSVGDGDLTVNVSAPGTAIASGDYAIAKFVSGAAETSVLSVPKKGGSATLGTIRIVENAIGAVGNGETIIMKLPSGYTWGTPAITASNDTTFAAVAGAGTRTATFTCTFAGTTHPGIFDITTPVTFTSSASKGDITVSFSGTADITGDLVIGEYIDYGVKVTAATAKDVVSAKDDQRIANVTVKEDIPGSLIPNRTIKFKLPSNTRFNTAPTLKLISGNNIWATTALALNADEDEATATLAATASTSGAELRLENVDIDVAANVSGEIEMEVSGTAGASGTVVVANADKVIEITSEPKDVVIGTQAQVVGDIVITEGAKEALAAGSSEVIWLDAPAGVTFANVPTVEVVEGDFEYDTVTRQFGNTTIQIVAKTQSTKASKIKVSNIKLTADRAVPEGPVEIAISGKAVLQNSPAFTNVTDAGSAVVANVVTPAPVSNAASFVIGDSSYTVNGEKVAMDAAPYIKNGRTMLPVRFAANAVGVSDDNILWDGANKKVTIIKGERVVQFIIGSNVMTVNGATITMDVAPEITKGRTMLPLRYVGYALGASINWDGDTQTVTIQAK